MVFEIYWHYAEVRFVSFFFNVTHAFISDPALGEEWDPKKTDFRYGVDLVKFIRHHFGDYFVICVAGK